MRLLWLLAVVICVFGAYNRLTSLYKADVSRLTCGMKFDNSCLKMRPSTESPLKAEPQSPVAQARKAEQNPVPDCQAGQGENCRLKVSDLGRNDEDPSMRLAAKGCENRTPKSCVALGRALLQTNRVRDSLQAFATGCAQADGEACVALGDIGSQLGDKQSVTFGYYQGCHIHKYLVACRNYSRLLHFGGREHEAIDAALAPCLGKLEEKCLSLLLPATNSNGQPKSLRLAYLARSQRQLQKLLSQDNAARTHYKKLPADGGRQKLIQIYRDRSIPYLQTLLNEARILSEAQISAPDENAFNLAVSGFTNLLHTYERGLRFELLFLNSGASEHWSQARDAYTAINRYLLQDSSPRNQTGITKDTPLRSPASVQRGSVTSDSSASVSGRMRLNDRSDSRLHRLRRADRTRT